MKNLRSLEQFSIRGGDNLAVQGEYEGNVANKRVVIFSHGFGVERDSRGMFTELGDRLKNEFLVIRFDYVEVLADRNATLVCPLKSQQGMLEKVIGFVRETFEPDEINIVAHSLGCVVVGLLAPENVRKIVLNAAPISSPYQRLKEYFSRRPGTVIDELGISKVRRSDGSLTFIEAEFWSDIKSIDPVSLYENLANKSEVYFVRALDQVIEENYVLVKEMEDIQYVELSGNHEFEGDARARWLSSLADWLI